MCDTKTEYDLDTLYTLMGNFTQLVVEGLRLLAKRQEYIIREICILKYPIALTELVGDDHIEFEEFLENEQQYLKEWVRNEIAEEKKSDD